MPDPVLFEKKPWPSLPKDINAMYVIYDDKTREYPGYFVLRRWFLYGRQELAEILPRLGYSLEDIREHLPPGKVRLERDIEDNPSIVEIWV